MGGGTFFCKYMGVSKILGIVWGINSIWLCFEKLVDINVPTAVCGIGSTRLSFQTSDGVFTYLYIQVHIFETVQKC